MLALLLLAGCTSAPEPSLVDGASPRPTPAPAPAPAVGRKAEEPTTRKFEAPGAGAQDRRDETRGPAMSAKEPFIPWVADEDAEGQLGEIYEQARRRAGKVFNIIRIMSLRPEHIPHVMGAYQTMMLGPSGLGRDEREMVATVVSRANDCFY